MFSIMCCLSRNGQLEHPHFMETTLSSSDGLHLTDVMKRLDALRGKGMATLYSRSSKRSYKNGFACIQHKAKNTFSKDQSCCFSSKTTMNLHQIVLLKYHLPLLPMIIPMKLVKQAASGLGMGLTFLQVIYNDS